MHLQRLMNKGVELCRCRGRIFVMLVTISGLEVQSTVRNYFVVSSRQEGIHTKEGYISIYICGVCKHHACLCSFAGKALNVRM